MVHRPEEGAGWQSLLTGLRVTDSLVLETWVAAGAELARAHDAGSSNSMGVRRWWVGSLVSLCERYPEGAGAPGTRSPRAFATMVVLQATDHEIPRARTSTIPINGAAARNPGPEEVSPTQVKVDASGGSTVYVATAEASARACRSCGAFAARLKDHRTARPGYVHRGRRPVSVQRHEAHCHRTGTALRSRLVRRADTCGTHRDADHNRCAPGGGGRGLRRLPHRRAGGPDRSSSWRTVRRCFEDHTAKVPPETPPVTGAIGIDETGRGEPAWRQNPATAGGRRRGRRRGFIDAIAGRGLFGQVEGRNAARVADGLVAKPDAWHEQVRRVAIDPCRAFRAAHETPPHTAMTVGCSHILPACPELVTLAATVEQRWDRIGTFLLTGITNTASQGRNHLIKL